MGSAGPALDAWRSGPGDAGEWLALSALAVAAALCVVIWLTGAAGGWLASGRGPRLSASATLTVLIRLPSHLRDPRSAWPAPWPPRLPAAVWFYLVAGAVAAALVVAAAGAGSDAIERI